MLLALGPPTGSQAVVPPTNARNLEAPALEEPSKLSHVS